MLGFHLFSLISFQSGQTGFSTLFDMPLILKLR